MFERSIPQPMDTESLVNQFHEDGFLMLRGVLSPEYTERLRHGVERAFENPRHDRHPIIQYMMFERGAEFEELIDHSPTVDIAEAILGDDCHLIAMSALRTVPGQSVAGNYHVDDVVRFPGMEIEPPRRMPCQVVNMNYYLVDVDEELGPTHLVPGSHRSGRSPEPGDFDADDNPSYKGRGIFSAVGQAGDLIMWHDQVWHRGSPNRSADRTRLVQQTPFSTRAISQRFYPFVNYHMPEDVIARANPRRKRLLGFHPRGAYG